MWARCQSLQHRPQLKGISPGRGLVVRSIAALVSENHIMPRVTGKEWKAVRVLGLVCLYCSLLWCCASLESFPGQSGGSQQRHDCGGIMRRTHFRHARRLVVRRLIWMRWDPAV